MTLACISCGVTEPAVLRRSGSRLIEQNHLVGRANDAKLTAPMCRNCHALYTAAQYNRQIDLEYYESRNLLEWTADFVLQLAYLFSQLALRLERMGTQLRELVVALDVEYPAWRSISGIQVRTMTENREAK